MELKNLFQNDDRAVSPVIGVILMVAITVILAAVIGTFVLGLGDDIDSNPTAGVTVSGDDVTLTSLGPNTDGIRCGSTSTETVGETINCTGEDSVVAYRGDFGTPDAESVVRTL